jgi:hypothetical protein
VAHSRPSGTQSPPRRATRTAGAVVVVVTLVALGFVLREFPGVALPVAIGSAGAVGLAVTLGLSTVQDRPVAGVSAGLLVVPVGAAVLGSVLVAVVLLVEDIFPVEEEALLSVGWLLLAGQVGVVVGCTVAAFGLVVALRNVVSDGGLADGTRIAVAAGAVPTGVTVVFLLVALGAGTPDAAVVAPLANPVGMLVSPLAAVVPGLLLWPSLLAATVLLVAAALGRLQERLTASRVTPGPGITGAIAGGVVSTVAVVAVSERVYSGAVREIIDRFPEQLEAEIQDLSTTAATTYGESTLLLLAAMLCVGVVVGLLGVVRLAVAADLLDDDSAGSSLAGIGVFLAAVFAGTVGAPAWLVVTGVAASLLVWDAGRFGTGLAREAAPGRTRRVELVHLAGTALVGVLATAAALLVIGWLPAEQTGLSAADLLALCSFVVGLLALAVALR